MLQHPKKISEKETEYKTCFKSQKSLILFIPETVLIETTIVKIQETQDCYDCTENMAPDRRTLVVTSSVPGPFVTTRVTHLISD